MKYKLLPDDSIQEIYNFFSNFFYLHQFFSFFHLIIIFIILLLFVIIDMMCVTLGIMYVITETIIQIILSIIVPEDTDNIDLYIKAQFNPYIYHPDRIIRKGRRVFYFLMIKVYRVYKHFKKIYAF